MSPPLQSRLGFGMIAHNRPQSSLTIAPSPDRQGGDANDFPASGHLAPRTKKSLHQFRALPPPPPFGDLPPVSQQHRSAHTKFAARPPEPQVPRPKPQPRPPSRDQCPRAH